MAEKYTTEEQIQELKNIITTVILANKIQQHIKCLTHHDQIFCPEMQSYFNIQRFLNVIHQVSKQEKK